MSFGPKNAMLVASSNPLLIICSTFRLWSSTVGPVRAGRALVLRIFGGRGVTVWGEAGGER
jgi:hypothetical protein